MNYKVSEIAKFTVLTAKKIGLSMNCNKLHLVVIQAWINYYKQTGTYLYNEPITAGMQQPTVSAIDYLYKNYGNNNIVVKSSLDLLTSIKSEDQNELKEILIPIIKTSTDLLLQNLCGAGSAWQFVKKNSKEDSPKIPFDIIISTTSSPSKNKNETPQKNKMVAIEPKIETHNFNKTENIKNATNVEDNSDLDFDSIFDSPLDSSDCDESKDVISSKDDNNDNVFDDISSESSVNVINPTEKNTSEYIAEDTEDVAINDSPDDDYTTELSENSNDSESEFSVSEDLNSGMDQVLNKDISNDEITSGSELDQIFDLYADDDIIGLDIPLNESEKPLAESENVLNNGDSDISNAFDDFDDFDDFSDSYDSNDSYESLLDEETPASVDFENVEANKEPIIEENPELIIGYDNENIEDKQLTPEQYRALLENEKNGILKLGPIKGLGKKLTNLIIIPRDKINGYELSGSFAIISISSPKNKPIGFVNNRDLKGVLSLSFDDSDGKFGMKEKDAKKIAEFVIKISTKAKTLIIQSDYGLSRSAGILAAIYTAFDMNGKTLFTSGDYCPNVHCYKLLLSAFDISYDENVINKLDEYSRENWIAKYGSLPRQSIAESE